MVSKFIGVKEFRQNISKYSTEALHKNIRFIILKKNVPILEVNPIDEKKYAYVRLSEELSTSEAQIKNGHFFTQEEVMREFNLL